MYFNNILAAIIGNFELAQAAHLDPKRLDGYLQSGLDASFRARDLVEQILSIGRRGQQKKQPLKIETVVKEVIKLLRATIPTTIAITHELDCDRLILADATQIHQVILNLCTNGYQAMQETGGCLRISLTETVISETKHFPSTDLPDGEYLRLKITDTGSGMDKATQKIDFCSLISRRKRIKMAQVSDLRSSTELYRAMMDIFHSLVSLEVEPAFEFSFRYFQVTNRFQRS